jgi:uncharacterized protein
MPRRCPSGGAAAGRSYDSSFEQALAREFAARLGHERGGWSLTREDVPVVIGETVFLPDFTVRHRDGRSALVEIVGFWTPEYLEAKLRKLRERRLDNLVLVVYRALAAGSGPGALLSQASGAPVVWFDSKPRVAAVMEAVERVATRSP